MPVQNKEQEEEGDEIVQVLEKLRTKLASRGVRGIISIGKNFRVIDDNNSGCIDFNEFKKAAKDFRFGLNEDELKIVFDTFDKQNNGTIDYDEFLRTIRGEMNDFRRDVVMKAFAKLDKDKSGVVDMEDIKNVYNAHDHPDVQNGKKNEDEILLEFLETFETNHTYLNGDQCDGKVSVEEFIEYYENVAMNIDDDAYFEALMNNVWGIGENTTYNNNKKGWSNKQEEETPKNEEQVDAEPKLSDSYSKRFGGSSKRKQPYQQQQQMQQPEESKQQQQQPMYQQAPPRKQGRMLGERNAKVGTYSNAPFGTDNEPTNYSTSNNPKGRGGPKEMQFSSKGDDVLLKFRNKIAARGTRGIMSIRRAFMIADDDNSKTIDINEFAKFCDDYRINLQDDEISKLFALFDRDGSGKVDYDEFLAGVVGEMNDFRVGIVKRVFNKLDKNRNGMVELDDIRNTYNTRNHPDILAGKKTEDEVLAEFLDTFEYHFNLLNMNKTDDQKVSLEEFIEYYNNISMSIPDDQYFEVMMTNAWNLDNKPNYGRGWRSDI